MKKILMAVLVFIGTAVAAKESGIRFNGSIESVMSFQHDRAWNQNEPDYGRFSWGMSNQANLRLKATIGEWMTAGLSFNVNTLSGSFTEIYQVYYAREVMVREQAYSNLIGGRPLGTAPGSFLSLPFYYKSTYIGSIELERLYFKAGNDVFDIETGLIRLAHGFGYFFSPMDFLNTPDPVFRNARPDGKLALIASFYPSEMWQIELFGIAPDNPVESRGWGSKFGASTKFNFKKVNIEILYTLMLPDVEYDLDLKANNLPDSIRNDFTHVAGVSLKADIEIGLMAEAVYRFDHKAFRTGQWYGRDFKGYEGLEASLGIDYTLPGGKVYLLLEYLFYGPGAIDWQTWGMDTLYQDSDWDTKKPSARIPATAFPYARHDYVAAMIRGKVNDYLTLGGSYLFGCDDQSAILTAFSDIEPFQAFTISIQAVYPLDWKMVNSSWNAGEFGSTSTGFYQSYRVTCRVKF